MSALAERVQLLVQNLEEQEPEDVMQQSASPLGYLALRHSLKVRHPQDVHSQVPACTESCFQPEKACLMCIMACRKT